MRAPAGALPAYVARVPKYPQVKVMTGKHILKSVSIEVSSFMQENGYVAQRQVGRFVKSQKTLDIGQTLCAH
jgi:hypothetical protein